ncbi:MAG: caspase family protein [Bacteroidales bacterium]|nr:caspase family protein [Bacteroidales bacterium]MBN2755802.1 caspase family protein [Bacteroidales bacterium]
MKNIITILISLLLSTTIVLSQNNQKRIALIVGNSAYPGGQALNNPVNDANLIANTLQSLDFTVIKQLNATKASLEKVIYEFSRSLRDFDVALFYYAGHGMQIDGKNYLIPVDAKLSDKTAVKFEAVAVDFIVEEFENYPNNTNIVILDACRDNPFRSWDRGSARGFKAMQPASGTIIAFATSEGSTAADGEAGNGLYTTYLVQEIKKPQRIIDVFNNTRIAVENASNGAQSPQEWTKLKGAFYFSKPANTNVAIPSQPQSAFIPGDVVYSYGSILIDSEIEGDFYIDGEFKGRISKNSKGNKLPNIQTGNHTIKIVGDENWIQIINIVQNQTSYLNVKSSKPNYSTNTLYDNRNGNYYPIKEINGLVWMTKNLTYYSGSGCWISENKNENLEKYGYLYNWKTALNVCPTGWRLPTKYELEDLINKYGGQGENAYVGLKQNGTAGFSPAFGAWRDSGGSFNSGFLEKIGYYWSSTELDENDAWYMYIYDEQKLAKTNSNDKDMAISVRCVKK